jgi:hypothetical protein
MLGSVTRVKESNKMKEEERREERKEKRGKKVEMKERYCSRCIMLCRTKKSLLKQSILVPATLC